jgi:tetratricopeptide (TPR) repeat protein
MPLHADRLIVTSAFILAMGMASLTSPPAAADDIRLIDVEASRDATPSDTVPLYEDLGDHHRPITTKFATAQRYFDQGLRLVYAFNHPEAIRAFNEAARLDPNCAICYWGAALAYGPNINAPMDSASGVQAYAAVQRALALAPKADERERAYIEALAKRYAEVPPAERAALDSAYARAMREVADRYPDDLDAATLYAEALMDLSPWNYWTRERDPRPDTREIVGRLEGVLARSPNHPGACHYYIHAVEAAYPEKAVACAERLAQLMPGAGHIVHMPGHIYIRVGRYADAIASNVHAVHTDETYIADQQPTGIYVIGYYPHNYHFLSFASTMAGRSREAIDAARPVVTKTPVEAARQVPQLEPLLAYLHLTLVTFGRWQEVLEEPMPPADLPVATGLAHYARGVAHAAMQQWSEAEGSLSELKRVAESLPAGDGKTLLEIATHALQGEIASRKGDLEAGVKHFHAAAEIEDGMLYIEPPAWYYPIRHSLGAVLLKAGRAKEAESAYREDLERFPENGWSLFGLAASLRAQGRSGEAAEVEERFRRAWEDGDVRLTASRF